MTNQTYIVWDLGATKCGAAKITIGNDYIHCDKHTSALLTNYHSLDNLVDHIENELELKHQDTNKVLIAGAGVFDGHVLQNENAYPFKMDFARLAFERNWPIFRVVNDYVPVLCSTFTPYIHDEKNVMSILPGKHVPFGRHVVFGLGTGLGLKDGALLPNNQLWLGQNEMGHVGITIPPSVNTDERLQHDELMHFLLKEFNLSLTFETVLSGKGLSRLHQFCTGNQLSSDEISKLLHAKQAEQTAALFAWYLGLFIGCVQLAFIPTGGIWMSGGVLKKNPLLVQHPNLLKGIHAHPAYLKLREDLPLNLMLNDELIYLGGAYYALNYL